MDQSVAIQEILTEEENCLIFSKHAVQCLLLVDDLTESRLLGLVEHDTEHALFMFTHRRMAITGDDVTLELIVPISHDFAIVEVSSPDELAIVGADTRVRVTDLDLEMEVHLPFGSHTRLFLGEVNRAWSEVCKQSSTEAPVSQFEWLSKYRRPAKGPGPGRQVSAPGRTPFSKISQLKKSGKASVGNGRAQGEEEGRTVRAGGDSGPESLKKVPSEDRNDLVRSSRHTVSNKAQILAMPQFVLRDNLIKCELLKNEQLYTYIKNYSFFLGTYNVNGQPPKESLRPWLCCTPEPPDFYCVGFQELDLSKEAFFFNDTPKEVEWLKAVLDDLHPEAKYALVKLARLVGIMLVFLVKKEHAEHVSDVVAETVGTGVLGRMGNKGAAAIRFRFHNSDICVVNSHLAAHMEEWERRNQDYRDICSRLLFPQIPLELPPLTIMKHDIVLWLGDLNYRLHDVEVDQVKNLLSTNDFKTLQSYDQLKRLMAEQTVFEGFVEGEISFQPTYKYDTGSDEWDTSEKCRTPAWCDRVLWKGRGIKQLQYNSHMTLKLSDHKPVSSLLEVGIKEVNEESYRKVFEDIVRNLDKMENECIPSVTLSKREFVFHDVKFMKHQVDTLTICNDGQVPCQFEFIQKPNEAEYCKPWLTANPPRGFLAQGDTLDIELEVFVNRWTATRLNSGEDAIEDILVLHLDRGKDYFVSVSGNYLPSCFGSSIQMLCHLRDPIQEVPLKTVQELTVMSAEELSLRTSEKPLDIPKEIWMMVDHLYRNASKQEDIFQQPGLRSEFEEIRDCLDTGMPESLPGSNHSVAEALLLFLDALPEPVVSVSHYQQCLDSCPDPTQCKKVISTLPLCNKNVFNYLTAFLRELLRNSAQNHLDANIVATTFAPLLLRPRTKQDITEKRKTQDFLHHFLIQDLYCTEHQNSTPLA
ncbi:type II inositol 1,4,5-trisphosphate 5-phosphatase isoform X3 [Megalops cyprinoides]|uniref:type II inositol 1,4,5-trisphosphate 5-phosphatase isoform X3 n=1 Tax=Megalops cyprinoides TaxID=118141 RepID=UPI0018652422|nr:type II inositol 1,4,5-trisphosphate 5-phosphatase isoform X3 [Megalops cyprinoides]